MPLLLGVLCVLAIAYRYYSAFLAAKVAMLNDLKRTPAHEFNDGQNYHPTNKWVLFGHHFAAISGAGPLIGPVLAIQYGYMPGLLWLVIGVCLAGAVQDMLVLAASVRRGGKSLAEIALTELGKPASLIVSVAILFIVVIALAGLGFVVVKALGGEEVKLPEGMEITLPPGQVGPRNVTLESSIDVQFVEGCTIRYTKDAPSLVRPEKFILRIPTKDLPTNSGSMVGPNDIESFVVTKGCVQLVAGSAWGTFTIACTIPIALFVSFWMYRFRKGHVVEASAIGAVGVLIATVAGGWVQDTPMLHAIFSLTKNQTIFSLCAYGFIASVLPVWMLLCPRDYISSFLKIGTIALLVLGVVVANPALPCPMVNPVFSEGGPTFPGNIFPFVFICIMCGSISGFHSLVASGTTPKMVNTEGDIRMIGYGSMLIEGLVGVVALIAAASLPVDMYYDINVDLDKAPQFQGKLDELYKDLKIDRNAAKAMIGVENLHNIKVEDANLAQMEQLVGGESLRGRTGGAVTLAVGMSRILTQASSYFIDPSYTGGLIKYWYHFAIMFEALFILTTIDTGTRIGRFLFQETLGQAYPKFAKPDWLPGSILATGIITLGWGTLVSTGSIGTIWPMFGIANQLLAVLALCLVTTLLINTGRAKYAWVTLIPMAFVTSTTMTAGVIMVRNLANHPSRVTGILNLSLTVFVMASVGFILLWAISRWVLMMNGRIKVKPDVGPEVPRSNVEETGIKKLD
ncbi:MAG: carbon starvation protein A [Gemmataceae bacterium]|nr:carbon starvation protein A [Gemmataceae bacterium]